MRMLLPLQLSAFIFSFVFTLMPENAQAQYSQLSVKIERYTSSTGEIDVHLKNAEHYAGFRLIAVEVVAGALVETATITVDINKSQQQPELQLGPSTLNYRIVPSSNFFIGQGAEKIKLRTINPAYIKNVNLILIQ